MPAVELSDRELGAWIVEYVMRWTEGNEYHFVDTPDGKELLAYDPALPGQGQGLRTSSRTWDPTNDLNACARAEAKIAEACLGGYYSYKLTTIYWRGAATDLDGDTYPAGRYLPLLATARQRCEAMWLIREKIGAANATREVE